MKDCYGFKCPTGNGYNALYSNRLNDLKPFIIAAV
jgi:hypothetical protein